MFKRNSENTEQSWRSKYYNSLGELEKKEQEWGSLEAVMRTAVSRLSVMLEGADRDLDKELEYLRHGIRRGADGKKIKAILNSVLVTIERVEKEHEKKKKLTTPVVYTLLLDTMPFPKGMARNIKALKKLISRMDANDNLDEVVQEFSELIRSSFYVIKSNAEEKAAEKNKKELKAVKGKRGETEIATEDESDIGGRTILELLLNQLSLPDDCQAGIKIIRDQLHVVHLEQELDRIAVEIANVLNDALADGDSIEQPDEPVNNEAGMDVNEVLLQLLERIELPAEANEELESIQLHLDNEVSEGEWPLLLERISKLIRSMREKVQQEKNNLESFLAQLTDQLQTLDNFIRGVEQDHHESIGKGIRLTENMNEHIQHMGKSVDEASGLGQLKDAIKSRLTMITKHMGEFRDHEQGRDIRAQKKISELNDQISGMEKDSKKLREKIMEERELASIDPLTEIKNRLAYDERIEQDYARWKRYHSSLSLMVIDIDRFKNINDSYGHMAGDKVLHTVAQHLQKNIRETDFLARYGGEEFVIIMPDTSANDGLGVAEKLREGIENCGFHYRDEAVNVTISCGVAEFRDDQTPAQVFEKADGAMYRAKESGRNRCLSA